MVDKGKKIALGKDSTGKRKRDGVGDGDKAGFRNKKPGVLQFFEDAADVDDDASDDSIFDSLFDDDIMEEDLGTRPKAKNDLGKAHNLPFIPKEEEIDEEEFDKMMEERFKQGSRFVNYAEDDYETKRSVERDYHMPSSEDPTIWKVKCMVGRERHSAFCLMQKFVDLKSLGSKLQIISVFAVEHVKGSIYIEADKQCDVIEACKGLSGIYSSRMAPVLKNDVSYLLSAQSKYAEVSEGTWAYVKNGKYKGDLTQIVAVNKERKRATVKLIPRIDLQALAAKFGGGASIKKPASVAPRLISSSELEEFRPLIQFRRDRDTDMIFENLDGLMFKDGYLYKKVSMDSLSCWGVAPCEEDLLKFAPAENKGTADMEWLSQLYGEEKKKKTVTVEKGGGKGEGSSSSSSVNFELYELVCFGRKDFGLIVGMEKDDSYKVLQEGSKGPTVVTVERRNLKNLTSDMKFTAFDHCMKTISVNDTVRISEGPSEGKQGIVKQIYRGIIFLYDENETENGGYICSKSQLCEKIKLFGDACNEKGGGSGDPGFEDFPSSPKSPLSPKKPWQAKEFNSDFKRGDKDGMFSVGQTLRIRVGPLKGYLCRVLAIRYSDVTVKLDSQQKVLTVRSENLAEVRGKSFGISKSEDPGSSSYKPFDMPGTEGGTGDWTNGAGTSAEGDGWNAGGASSERSTWPSFTATGNSLQLESSSWNNGSSVNDPKKDTEDSAWGGKGTTNQNSSWGAAAADGKNDDCWNKAADKNIFGSSSIAWGDATAEKNLQDSWGKGKGAVEAGATVTWEKDGKGTGTGIQEDSWGKAAEKLNTKDDSNGSNSDWNKSAPVAEHPTNSWGKQDGGGGSSWGKQDGGSSQGNRDGGRGSSWGKQDGGGGSSWGKQDGGGSSWGKKDGGSSQGNQDGGSSWGKQDGGSSWGKKDGGSSQGNQDGGSSWGKQDGGSSWGKKDGGSSQGNQDGGSSWGKQDGGSSWGKQDAGSSWGKQADQQDGLDKAQAFDGGCGSGGSWGRGRGLGGRVHSGRERSFGQGQSSSWKDSSGNNWTSNGSSSGNQSSWKEPTASGEDTGSGWKKGWGTDKETCESGDKLDRNQGSSWGQKSNWNSGSSSAGEKQEWNSGSNNSNQDSSWGKKANWNAGSSDGNQDSNWAKKSDWNTGNEDQNEDRTSGGNWRGGSDGRDGSGREGFRGRGGSDRGGYGGRGRSDRGGYGGRGGFGGRDGSDRGFGGRGRGRRDQDDWGTKNNDGAGSWNQGGDNSQQKSWHSGNTGGRSDRGGYGGRGGFGGRDGSDRGFGGRGRGRRDQDDWGTKNNDGAGSWNQGGDNSQQKSWHSGNTGASSHSGGWSGQSSGWTQTTGAKDAGGSNTSGGWNKGSDGSAQSGGWNKGSSDGSSQAGGWNKGSGENTQSGGWNKGSDGRAQAGGWGNESSNRDQPKSWNQSNAADGGQSSGWGQSKDKEEGSGGGQGPTDSWGKAAAGAGSSWGNGSGKGGW